MSTAAKVPETWELTGDDARKTLLETGRLKLVKDAFVRLRAADGFSHARSLAFVTSLVLVQGLVAVVGFTVAFGDLRLSKEIVQAIQTAFPGPVGNLLTDAVTQAQKVGSDHRYLPLVIGLAGTIVTGTTAMGQIERGFNRIYGIEQDRPTVQKYGRAFLLALGAGSMLACNFLVFTLGRSNAAEGDLVGGASPFVRWPLALVVAGCGAGRDAAVGAEAKAARVVVADVRSCVLRDGLGARDARARVRAAAELVLRRHVWAARGHRRAADLDAALRDCDLLRRGRRGTARGRPGRCSESRASSRRPKPVPTSTRRRPTRRRADPGAGPGSDGGGSTRREA